LTVPFRRKGENEATTRSCCRAKGGKPDLLAQRHELRRPELEDLKKHINDQVVVEDRQTGETTELPDHGQLPRGGGPVDEDQLHRRRTPHPFAWLPGGFAVP